MVRTGVEIACDNKTGQNRGSRQESVAKAALKVVGRGETGWQRQKGSAAVKIVSGGKNS